MVIRKHAEKVRVTFVESKAAVRNWTAVAASHASRLFGPMWRFGSARARTVDRFWQTLTLARRFYPNLQVAPDRVAVSTPLLGEDAFDPWIVRSLPRRMHALIRFRVAIRIGSAVRAEQAAALCRAEGWDTEQLGAASAGYDWSAFSEIERLVLRYTDDLTRTPMDVDMGTLRAIQRQLSSDQLIELAASIAQENFKARFHSGVGASRAVAEPAA
ncbi:MAG: hypothetical protein JWO13_140 [Acidobacteriales bacterium]|nr:hypothetical protein [Terriglobales bacterium]